MPNTVTKRKINRAVFYNKIRQSIFNGKLSQLQVEGMETLLNEWESRALNDVRWLAYILATVMHECAGTFRPIEEYGRGAGRKYGKKIKMNGKPYTTPDKIYFGRSYVQLTWYENYEAMGKHLGIDLLNNPELALHADIATKIIYEGMLFGMFTGKKLSDYFSFSKEDWINARRIINGQDCANLIAGYGHSFYTALI